MSCILVCEVHIIVSPRDLDIFFSQKLLANMIILLWMCNALAHLYYHLVAHSLEGAMNQRRIGEGRKKMSSESPKVLKALHEIKVANTNSQREKGMLGHHILFHKLDLNFIVFYP